MVKLTIAQINKELNYLEVNYQRLTIKTVEYLAEKAELMKQKLELMEMSDNDLAIVESKKKSYKTSKLRNRFKKTNGNAIQEEGRVIVGEDDE